MLKFLQKASAFLVGSFLILPGFAAIPSAPKISGDPNNGDYVQTAEALFNEVGKFGIGAVIVIVCIGYIYGLVVLWHRAMDQHKWGGFIGAVIAGLVILTIAFLVAAAANSAMPTIGG